MVLVITAVAAAGPMLPARSTTELATSRAPMVLPLAQSDRVMVNVMLFEVVITGVEAHPVIVKSAPVRPLIASLKVKV